MSVLTGVACDGTPSANHWQVPRDGTREAVRAVRAAIDPKWKTVNFTKARTARRSIHSFTYRTYFLSFSLHSSVSSLVASEKRGFFFEKKPLSLNLQNLGHVNKPRLKDGGEYARERMEV